MAESLESLFGDCEGGVDRSESVLLGPEQRKCGDSEEGVEDVDGISGPVRDSSFFLILAVQDEEFQGFLVDPILFFHHAEGRVDPPGVAHVWQFLRPTVEPALGSLSLAQPLCQQFLVKGIDMACYF